jgi:hypothetical protein
MFYKFLIPDPIPDLPLRFLAGDKTGVSRPGLSGLGLAMLFLEGGLRKLLKSAFVFESFYIKVRIDGLELTNESLLLKAWLSSFPL